jgi:hypothetical protein
MRILIVSALLACAGLSAAAQDTNTAAVGVTVACKQDLRKLCRPAPHGGPLKCLMDHKTEVAPGCRKALDSIKGASLPADAPPSAKSGSCLVELQKVCKDAKSKDLNACLKAHGGELSAPCRKVLGSAQKASAQR